MGEQKHIINRQTIELILPDRNNVLSLQNDISDLVTKSLISQLDQLFTRLTSAHQVLRLKKLELDLGVIHPDRLNDEFVSKVMHNMEEQLTKLLCENDKSSNNRSDKWAINVSDKKSRNTPVSLTTRSESDLEAVIYFLKYGLLPWWKKKESDGEGIHDLLDNVMKANLTSLRPSFLKLLKFETSRKRIIYQLNTKQKEALIKRLIQTNVLHYFLRINDSLTRFLKLIRPKAIVSQQRIDHVYWEHVLQLPTRETIEVKEIKRLIYSIIHDLVESTELSLRNQFVHTCFRVSTYDTKLTDQETIQLLRSAIEDSVKVFGLDVNSSSDVYTQSKKYIPQELFTKDKDHEISPKEGIDGFNDTKRKKTDDPSSEDDLKREALKASGPSKDSQEDTQDLAGHKLRRVTSKSDKRNDNYEKDRSSVRKSMDKAPGNDRHVDDELHEEKGSIHSTSGRTDQNTENIEQADKGSVDKEVVTGNDRSTAFIDQSFLHKSLFNLPTGEDIAITNAGLVILHPFLKYFFEGLGLMANDQFVDDHSANKGIHLLQYCANGMSDTPEEQLLLNKILCGIPPSAPVPRHAELTDLEKEECEHLLKTVLSQWTILKTDSPDALRTTFLNREGMLSNESGWTLKVQRNTIDILLDRLPWSISLIKLPWNKEIIYVEW